MIKELIEKAKLNKWDEVFDVLENEPPRMYDTFMREYILKHNNGEYPDFDDRLQERSRWLDSSERRTEYYNNIPEDEMTDEDWDDFKASVW